MGTVTGLKAQVKALIDEAAAQGQAAPSVRQAAERLGVSAARVSELMKELREGAPAEVGLDEIEVLPELEVREGRDEATVLAYAEAMEAGAEFPPMTVFRVGERLVLAAGGHRREAYRRRGVSRVAVRVLDGSLDDALAFAIRDNLSHGLRMSNADKRKAVTQVLKNAVLRRKSLREIAALCGVTHPFVARVKAELEDAGRPKPPPATATARGPALGPVGGGGDDGEAGPDPVDRRDDGPAPAGDAADGLCFEDWVETLPAREQIDPSRVEAFDREARLHFLFAQSLPYEQARKHAQAILKANVAKGELGPMSAVLRRFVALDHPRTWRACESCGGTGRDGRRACDECFGNGFTN